MFGGTIVLGSGGRELGAHNRGLVEEGVVTVKGRVEPGAEEQAH